MSILSSAKDLIVRSTQALHWSLENPRVPLSGQNISVAAGMTYQTQSGKPVTVWESLKWSPFYQGVKMIGQDVGSLRLKTYKVDGERKELAQEHPTFNLLYSSVGETTTNLFLEAMIHAMVLYGNAYAYVVRRGDGRPVRLKFINPWRVTMWRNMSSERIFYRVMPIGNNLEAYQRGGFYLDNKVPPEVRQKNMLHFRSYTPNGLVGMSVVRMARDSIARALSAEQYEDDFYKNAMVPYGYFLSPKGMSKEAQTRFHDGLRQMHAGTGNRHRSMILEEDMKWQATSVTPRDVLLHEAAEMNTIKAAQFLNIPAQLLQAKIEGSAYKSHTEITRRYYTMTLHPVMDRIERECEEKLFTDEEKERREYCTEFDTDGLLQSDTEQRMLMYRTLFELGSINPNEIRAMEGRNPREGGDEFFVPLNMGENDGEQDEQAEGVEESPQASQEDAQGNEAVSNEQGRSTDRALLSLLETEMLSCAERYLKPMRGKRITHLRLAEILDTIDEKHRAILLKRLLPVMSVATGEVNRASEISELLVQDMLMAANEIFRRIHVDADPDELAIRLQDGFAIYRAKLNDMVRNYYLHAKEQSNGESSGKTLVPA